MIIQFTVANFRSINKPQVLNFRATSLVSEDKDVDKRNIAILGSNKVLKTVGIYGANASGKSNVIKALAFFRSMVTNSLTDEDTSTYGFNPFLQSTVKVKHYGHFEMVLILDLKKYRYGFTLDAFSNIASEWLSGPAEKNETYYFTRKSNEITVNPLFFQEGDDLPKNKVRGNALFLSFCAAYNGKVSMIIKNFIADRITVENTLSAISRMRGTYANVTNRLVDSGNKNIVLRWMKEAGLPFSDIKLEKREMGIRMLAYHVFLTKNIYNEEGQIDGEISMNLDENESEGTKKFYSYVGKLHKKFEEGGVFISDEIDSNFHPTLLRKLLHYFNDPNVNKAGAQLLFSSHDTNLMSPEIMRRDQFYFTEKSMKEETILYSLSDLKGVRNNADFARQYLAGFYGALPVLGNYLENKKASDETDNKN